MTIEFRCTTCGKLLRTQEGTEGKKAKCPECGTVLEIPSASTASSPAPPPREPDFGAPPPHELQPARHPAGAPNPYQSPGAYSQVDPVAHGFHPTRIDFGTTLSRTWEIYKANLGPCIGGMLLMMVCNMVLGTMLQMILVIALAAVADQGGGGGAIVIMLLQQVVAQGVGAFFAVGMILFMLRIARGQAPDYAAIFGGGPYLLRAFAIQILLALIMLAGLILLIIPGVIFALMLSQALFVMVDQRRGVVDSFKGSIEAMRGNKLTVLAIWIVTGFLGLLVTLFTCFVGLIFVAPFGALLTAVIYLDVTGQKTVLEAPAPALPQQERDFGAPGVQPAGG
jgi:uncharacterized membrane protein/phage FluMu protein Com